MAHPEAPGDPRLMSGEAWSAFCDDLKAAGQAVLRGDATYRVSGTRGTVRYLGFQVTGGVFGYENRFNVRSGTHAEVMQIARDGSFELILSAQPQRGNWLPLDADSEALLVRQFFSDWERELPAELAIERIDAPCEPPVLTTEQLARRLPAVSSWVGKTANFWCDFVQARKERGVNLLHPPTDQGGGAVGDGFGFTSGTGAVENRYGEGHFVLEPDEVLLRSHAAPVSLLELPARQRLVRVARLRELRHEPLRLAGLDRRRRRVPLRVRERFEGRASCPSRVRRSPRPRSAGSAVRATSGRARDRPSP